MREVGAQLRHARQQRGEELENVAQYLRIRPAYLSGIEQGDLSGMPGRTYALGFLRTYADYLGFDGNDLIARVRSSVGESSARTGLRMHTPMPENRLPRTPLIVISLAVVVGIYLGWSYVNRTSRPATDTVAELPADLRPAASDPVPAGVDDGSPAAGSVAASQAAAPDDASPGSAASSSSAAATEEPAGQTTGDSVAEVGAGGAAADVAGVGPQSEREALAVHPAAGAESGEPAPVAMPAGGDPSSAAVPEGDAAPEVDQSEPPAAIAEDPDRAEQVDPARQAVALLLEAAAGDAGGARQVYERANTDARVILRVREQSWVEVSSPSGDYRFTRTLEPGEALLVPNRPDLRLWTGNARGLEIIVDGVPMSLPGGRLVRRNVSLDPERLLTSAAPSR